MIGKLNSIFKLILAIVIIPAVLASAQGVLKIYQESVGGKIYKLFYGQKLNWGNAFVACKAENSDLLSIDSLSELVYIRQFINNSEIGNVTDENVFFWTSGSDIYNEGYHIWMSNGREVLKTLWSGIQPDNYGGVEHCDHIWWRNGMSEFNDNQCNQLLNFICESESCEKQHTLNVSSFTLSTEVVSASSLPC